MMLYRVYLCRPAFHQLLHRTLWTLFGAPTSTFSRTLRRAEEALSKALNGFFPLMKVQQPSNADLQNAMCNGWLHAVFVTGRILTPLKDAASVRLAATDEPQVVSIIHGDLLTAVDLFSRHHDNRIAPSIGDLHKLGLWLARVVHEPHQASHTFSVDRYTDGCVGISGRWLSTRR
ncbi:hypothetical protein PC123_g18663 [Phytophthora cactorum]|nr:hypothetical protein PC123_g18663 [Phytophthora cactorum]